MKEETYNKANKLVKERDSISGTLRQWDDTWDHDIEYFLGTKSENIPHDIFKSFRSSVVNELRVRILEISKEIESL